MKDMPSFYPSTMRVAIKPLLLDGLIAARHPFVLGTDVPRLGTQFPNSKPCRAIRKI